MVIVSLPFHISCTYFVTGLIKKIKTKRKRNQHQIMQNCSNINSHLPCKHATEKTSFLLTSNQSYLQARINSLSFMS